MEVIIAEAAAVFAVEEICIKSLAETTGSHKCIRTFFSENEQGKSNAWYKKVLKSVLWVKVLRKNFQQKSTVKTLVAITAVKNIIFSFLNK